MPAKPLQTKFLMGFGLAAVLLLAPACGSWPGEESAKEDESESTEDPPTTPESIQKPSGGEDGKDVPGDGDGADGGGDSPDGGDGDAARVPCEPPAGVSNDPRTIQEATALFNALPKPVTIPCYVEVLKRPLKLNATASQLSVQPAVGRSNPRIFILAGSLITTFTAVGEGSDVIEFSHLLSDEVSVKGEIALPVTENLAEDAAFARIRKTTGQGTKCEGCHAGEQPAGAAYPEGAFKSTALKPTFSSNVTIDSLKEVAGQCVDDSERCQIYRALFGAGEVESFDFPKDMPTLF